ncbi:MAG: hypothetical protein MUE73_00670 [Planctomycetes bacterium]|jgi:hypothetical protein|nr:hypothetical protein [Planctomycetota bacterium]
MNRIAVLVVLLSALPAGVRAGEDPLGTALEAAKSDAARIRGLEFRADLKVRKITAEEFRREIMLRDVRRIFGEGETLIHMEALLRILRVIPSDAGLLDLAQRFFPATVAANYDPVTKQISFIREFTNPASLHTVMVHELTHALQDQHFDLLRMVEGQDLDFDRLLALGALVEGDAESTERTFETAGLLAVTPLETIRALGRTQVRQYLARMKDFPPGLARPFIFQYLDGLLFVETVKRARGGFPAIDRAYRDPPVSTEQILHPGRYLARDHPTTILLEEAPPGYRVLLANTLGELGLSIVLAGHIGEEKAETAADGWDGDRILLLARGEESPVLVWYTTFDSARDAGEFLQAAALMLGARRSAPLEPLGLFTAESLLQREDGRVAMLLAKGRDVVLIEGAPEDDSEAFAGALLKARKREVVVTESSFGSGR